MVEAVNAGFREGERLAAEAGHRIRVTALLTAMRHAAKSREIAELAVRYRDEGVAGFDIAGAEAGYPPTRHLDAFEYLRRENAHFTIHAGEAFGLPSIWEAIQWCGADRLGHGVRIVDDITVGDCRSPTGSTAAAGADDAGRRRPELGLPRPAGGLRARHAHPAGDVPQQQPADRRRDVRSALHPISLLEAAAVPGDAQHRQPADERHVACRARWRCWSARRAGPSSDLRWVTINAMKSAFLPFDERLALIDEVVKPGYDAALAGHAVVSPTG